jgi:hypothetical protein
LLLLPLLLLYACAQLLLLLLAWCVPWMVTPLFQVW